MVTPKAAFEHLEKVVKSKKRYLAGKWTLVESGVNVWRYEATDPTIGKVSLAVYLQHSWGVAGPNPEYTRQDWIVVLFAGQEIRDWRHQSLVFRKVLYNGTAKQARKPRELTLKKLFTLFGIEVTLAP